MSSRSTSFDCIHGALCLFLYVKVTKSRKSSTDTSVNQEVSKLDRDNYLQKTKKLFKASDPSYSGQEEEEPLHAVKRAVGVRKRHGKFKFLVK